MQHDLSFAGCLALIFKHRITTNSLLWLCPWLTSAWKGIPVSSGTKEQSTVKVGSTAHGFQPLTIKIKYLAGHTLWH